MLNGEITFTVIAVPTSVNELEAVDSAEVML